MNPKKYRPFPAIALNDRQWPSRQIMHAPIWCSVDLRDGNQSIPVPMTVAQKIEMFQVLVSCGFKEIEVGFPAASPTEFEFVRRLIEEDLIPDDVTIQVLVQARLDLIKQTVESLIGAKKVIIHMYNSTSPSQRRIVFNMGKAEIVELAMHGTELVKEYSAKLIEQGTKVIFQYSPESFSATEVDFALEVCEAVMSVWRPTPQDKIILNLPETVQVATPNVYADQIEWFCRNMKRRDCATISVHAHNDRGTGVASTELGILAGADRVEGTLFGNGERTGNTDIITVALNMYTQGIDPGLDFSDLESIREVYERCTGMKVPPRQPYSGELVFVAFSGSHQDAINKGLRAMNKGCEFWDVPYLIMDPGDVGRKYREVIRVNGQSGKAGIAYLLEHGCGIRMPKDMEREFGAIAGKKIDALGREVNAEDLRLMFLAEYINRQGARYKLEYFSATNTLGQVCSCQAGLLLDNSSRKNLSGEGNGPIDAFVNALRNFRIDIHVLDQSEHALEKGEGAPAMAYVHIQFPNGTARWGAGINTDSQRVSIEAIVSALNRE